MYRQSELSNSITPEEIIRTLSLCGITQKEQYTEDEADCFRECRKLIEQGKTDSEVIEALKQRDAVATKVLPKPKRQKNSAGSDEAQSDEPYADTEPKDISQLLALAKERVGTRITLSESLEILLSCGLQDQDEYNQAQCLRFLEACDLIKKQNKSVEEVAQHFGVTTDSPGLEDVDTSELLQQLGETTALLGEEERELIREMVRQKAKGDMAGLPKLYLQSLIEEMKSPQFQQEWQQLRDAFKARIMGKKPTSPTFPHQLPLMSLPPTSENGSTSS
ncbi:MULTISPECIES: hypothetical protein [unclassified Tolypothrix]|uniref:hypothetical protein n=1 Tax=unclassified Tolypothrix TaxID=2649714 RepID=UPI0005EABD2D|nr:MULTISPECIES: hypothetical protein [unclassified Tolypothrix]BAY95702.1 hypothetical protein NIES3275_77790 [Microchaete diplosiphon NIES-3275]EKE97313.1 hypothetical protein FDUTEX481_05251 [Tolypothrix sp. PCC 7601]MBE9082324.1 hypothetical protein [Tolypothrix sp. LEGE 11397]UYD30732.1 hypothetical protein HGR01_38545 [Tolypothrix sp. PCC 7712]UYD38666.1 hypothetical protein HG267_39645 [Tolypothrix sp. PCC 7601]